MSSACSSSPRAQLSSSLRRERFLSATTIGEQLSKRPLVAPQPSSRCPAPVHCMWYWSFIRVSRLCIWPARLLSLRLSSLMLLLFSRSLAFVRHPAFIVVADRIERRGQGSTEMPPYMSTALDIAQAGWPAVGAGSKSADQSWKSSE